MTNLNRTDAALSYDLETAREAAPAIQSWLDYQRRYLRTPGVQAAIRVGDELVLSTALGHSDEVAGTPLRTDHLFRIASHSKTFTATSILQLVEQGKVRLDDPIEQYVAELSGSALGPVTVRELLGHQGGVIRDGVDKDYWQLMDPFPVRGSGVRAQRVLQVHEHRLLAARPGDRVRERIVVRRLRRGEHRGSARTDQHRRRVGACAGW
jgi:CubicO group peptidase (beta-lactamase class C family)